MKILLEHCSLENFGTWTQLDEFETAQDLTDMLASPVFHCATGDLLRSQKRIYVVGNRIHDITDELNDWDDDKKLFSLLESVFPKNQMERFLSIMLSDIHEWAELTEEERIRHDEATELETAVGIKDPVGDWKSTRNAFIALDLFQKYTRGNGDKSSYGEYGYGSDGEQCVGSYIVSYAQAGLDLGVHIKRMQYKDSAVCNLMRSHFGFSNFILHLLRKLES